VHLKPGDLIQVDPADWAEGDEDFRRIVLTATPGSIDKQTNPVTASLQKGEVGLVIAVTLIKNTSRDRRRSDWRLERGNHLEVLALFGSRLGWNDAMCFSVVS
jgi:hypothetical protein